MSPENHFDGQQPREQEGVSPRKHLMDFSPREIALSFGAKFKSIDLEHLKGEQFYAFVGLVDDDYRAAHIDQLTFMGSSIAYVASNAEGKIDYVSIVEGLGETVLLRDRSLVVENQDGSMDIVRKATLVTHPRLNYESVRIGEFGTSIERRQGNFLADYEPLDDFQKQLLEECIEEGTLGEEEYMEKPYHIDQAGCWPESPKMIIATLLRDTYHLPIDIITPAKGSMGQDLKGVADIKTDNFTAYELTDLLFHTPEIETLEVTTRGLQVLFQKVDEADWDEVTYKRAGAYWLTQRAKGLEIEASLLGEEANGRHSQEASELRQSAEEMLKAVNADPMSKEELIGLAKAVVEREMPKYIKDGKIDKNAVYLEKKLRWILARSRE